MGQKNIRKRLQKKTLYVNILFVTGGAINKGVELYNR